MDRELAPYGLQITPELYQKKGHENEILTPMLRRPPSARPRRRGHTPRPVAAGGKRLVPRRG